MPDHQHRDVTFSAEEMASDLPAEVDVKKLRRVVTASEVIQRMAELSQTDVEANECYLLSESALREEWLSPEEDAAWKHLNDLPEIGEDK